MVCGMTAAADAQDAGKSGTKPNSQKVTSSGFSFLVEPEPSWVVAAQRDAGTQLPHSPLHYEIIDEQTRVDRKGADVYRHAVRVVDEPAGLGPAAQIQILFEPSYQVLVLHKMEIQRDGRRIDKLDRKKVQLLQRETALEYRIYDGRVTASIVLDDVRVGDRIDYAYSVRGVNPVFEGKYVNTAWVGADLGPMATYQFRLLAPENRAIAYRASADVKVSSSLHAGMRETLFRRTSVPQLQLDLQAPESILLESQIQLSEFGDWNEIARWGEKLFAPASAPSARIRERADAIRAAAATPAERLQHALDFVQTEVRYFGTEIGPNSHRPASPATVIEQRFGDCKDKVALLLALLRELDIDAAPVLVSTRYRGQVDSMLASPLAFDHAITRVQLGDKAYWLDGTRAHQKGSLVERQSIGLDKGLVLRAASASLAELPGTATEERISVDETFRITQFSEAPALESRITYFGEFAEYMRGMIAAKPIGEIEKFVVAEYARFYPRIRSSASMRIEEAPNQNAVIVVQQFTLPEFWRFPEQRLLLGEVGLWNVIQALRYPTEPSRRNPFRIQSPGIYRHSVTFEFPEDVARADSSARFDDGDAHFEYHVTYGSTPRRVQIQAELRLLMDAVAAADWPVYMDKLVKLRTRFVAAVSVPAVTLAQVEKLNADLRALGESMRARNGSIKVVTPVQREARTRHVMLTAQLDGGRLSQDMRAEALRERGIQLDHIGLYDAASADLNEALRLAPGDAKTYAAAAVNAFSRGDDALAAERAGKALQLAPSDTEPRRTRALFSYYSNNYADAKQEFLKLLKNRVEVERLYPVIWLYLAARRNGEDGNEAIKQFLPAGFVPRWPYPILQLMTGSATYEQAIKSAKEDGNDPSKLCELYFYTGEKYLLDGNKSLAREYFQKSIDTGVVEYQEYALAKRAIKGLGGP
jgi:lipoprotein NlpI/transglutaminase-like putative cysteine protease